MLTLRFVECIFSVFQNLSLLTKMKQQGKLSKADQINGVSEFKQKIIQHRPRIACFVGLGIADIVKSVLVCVPQHLFDHTAYKSESADRKKNKTKTAIGLQPYKLIYPDGSASEFLKVGI
jgi:thymine-DNA glycosylase